MQRLKEQLSQFYMSSFQNNFGWLRPISDGSHLIRLDWNQIGWNEPDQHDNVSRETSRQLQAYFNNQLCEFILPLAPVGKTVTSQHWLTAMSKIPCHRIIRTNGTLGNYKGGSNLHATHSSNLARKAALLYLESKRNHL